MKLGGSETTSNLKHTIVILDHKKMLQNSKNHFSGGEYKYDNPVIVDTPYLTKEAADNEMKQIADEFKEKLEKEGKRLDVKIVNENAIEIYDRTQHFFSKNNELLYSIIIYVS